EGRSRLVAKVRTSLGVDDKAGRAAVLRAGRTCQQFKGLEHVRWQLHGEGFVLLIASRLPVNNVTCFTVIALWMEESIRNGDYAARSHGDGIAQALCRCGDWEVAQQSLSNVSVR